MHKFELTKTIEALKLNPRTLRSLGPQKTTIPFGAVLENVSQERDSRRFFYLGEPYECPEADIGTALRPLV